MPWKPVKVSNRDADSDRFYDRGKRKFTPELAAAKRIRSSVRWQKVRENKLSANPLCEDPFQEHSHFGIIVPSETVHHKKGLDLHPELAFELDNLCSLCSHCHARIEQMTRSGQLDLVGKLWQ